MATTATLKFEKITTASGDVYAAKFASTGAVVVEIERDKNSLVAVSANLEGMGEVPIDTFDNPYMANAIFEIDLPEGVQVTIKSTTEVKNAKMLK